MFMGGTGSRSPKLWVKSLTTIFSRFFVSLLDLCLRSLDFSIDLFYFYSWFFIWFLMRLFDKKLRFFVFLFILFWDLLILLVLIWCWFLYNSQTSFNFFFLILRMKPHKGWEHGHFGNKKYLNFMCQSHAQFINEVRRVRD